MNLQRQTFLYVLPAGLWNYEDYIDLFLQLFAVKDYTRNQGRYPLSF